MIVPIFVLNKDTSKNVNDAMICEWILRCGVVGKIQIQVDFNDAEVKQVFDNHLSIIVSQAGLINCDLIVAPLNPGSDVDYIINVLNKGFKYVLLNGSIQDCMNCSDALPEEARSRLIIQVDAHALASSSSSASASSSSTISSSFFIDLVTQTQAMCGGYHIVNVSSLKDLVDLASKCITQVLDLKLKKTLKVSIDGSQFSSNNELESAIGKLHLLKSDNTVDVTCPCKVPSEEVVPVSIGGSFAKCLKPSDRSDGLFATVVVDEVGIALGLCYSNEQSLIASVNSGRGVYWSRTRGLWRKGDTSGAYQELLSMRLDCDNDAIRFAVNQRGDPPAFCHQNTRTCWGTDSGFSNLFRVLESRKKSAPEGSYTKKLFDNPDFLRSKLVEEAQELSEAVVENNKKHVAEETADVIYFALVACASGNANLNDVKSELDKRHLQVKRRPGLAKEHRIQAANEILKKN